MERQEYMPHDRHQENPDAGELAETSYQTNQYSNADPHGNENVMHNNQNHNEGQGPGQGQHFSEGTIAAIDDAVQISIAGTYVGQPGGGPGQQHGHGDPNATPGDGPYYQHQYQQHGNFETRNGGYYGQHQHRPPANDDPEVAQAMLNLGTEPVTAVANAALAADGQDYNGGGGGQGQRKGQGQGQGQVGEDSFDRGPPQDQHGGPVPAPVPVQGGGNEGIRYQHQYQVQVQVQDHPQHGQHSPQDHSDHHQHEQRQHHPHGPPPHHYAYAHGHQQPHPHFGYHVQHPPPYAMQMEHHPDQHPAHMPPHGAHGHHYYVQHMANGPPPHHQHGAPPPHHQHGGHPHHPMMKDPKQSDEQYNQQMQHRPHHPHPVQAPPPQEPSPKQETSEKKRKRPADMPRRPLSGYNFFFSEERIRMLASINDPPESKEGEILIDENDSGKGNAPNNDNEEPSTTDAQTAKKSAETSAKLLLIRDTQAVTRRPHRKSHGKIAFKDLAKEVGKRWRALKDNEKTRYSAMAEKDLQRYNEQMKAYNSKRNRFANVSYQTAPGPLPPQFSHAAMNVTNAQMHGHGHLSPHGHPGPHGQHPAAQHGQPFSHPVQVQGQLMHTPMKQPQVHTDIHSHGHVEAQGQPPHISYMNNHPHDAHANPQAHVHGHTQDQHAHQEHVQHTILQHNQLDNNNGDPTMNINVNSAHGMPPVDGPVIQSPLVDHRRQSLHQHQEQYSVPAPGNVNVGGGMPPMEGDLQQQHQGGNPDEDQI